MKRNRMWVILRYDWPLHFFLGLTSWLPDNVVFLRLRGKFARHFFNSCGTDLRLGRNLEFYDPKNISIGNNVYIAFGCVFLANSQITIEDEVIFGPYVVVAAGNHTRIGRSFRYGVPQLKTIRIGCGSWIGAHATLTAGCVIGEGSLVAAGAVVNGSVPSDVVVGGVPAKVIKVLTDDKA